MKNTKNSRVQGYIDSFAPKRTTTDFDLQILDELSNEIDVGELEKYIFAARARADRREDRKQSEKKELLHPFRDTSTQRLEQLLLCEHAEVIIGAREELARRRLIDFTTLTYPGYMTNWHHVEYAKKLDAFIAGDIKKLMVFMPPQHGKSEQCSRRMPAKLLGNNPDCRIAIVSYAHPLATSFNRDIQRIIDTDDYRAIYPDTQLGASNVRTVSGAPVRNSDEFEIVNHRGGVITVGVGGGLTGRPVDVFILDDPYKDQKAAWSPRGRRSVQDWYDAVADTRLHNKSQQLITLTRWHEDDVASHLLKAEGDQWDVVIFPAIKEGPPSSYDPRKPGEALWPEMHSLERILAVKKRNIFVFDSLYQQNPKPAEGLLFPPDALSYFDQEDIQDVVWDSIVAVSDVADKGRDYYCMLIAGLLGDKIYILDVIYTQAPVKYTIPRTVGKLTEWRPAKHRIESNNGGSIFAHGIKEKKTTFTTIEETFTSTNKETRILMASGQIIEHCVFRSDYLPDDEYAEYMGALTGYLKSGGNEHDDAPDATTMLIEMINPVKESPIIIIAGSSEKDIDVKVQKPGFMKKIIGHLSGNRQHNSFWD